MNLENLKQALDVGYFLEYRWFLLAGLASNFYVFALSAILSIVVGFLVCMMRISRRSVLRSLGTFHTEVFRNAPEYVLLVWIHFVLPLALSLVLRTRLNFPPLFSAVLALGLAFSGYFTETFRAGILAVPKGHIDAGRALGMSWPLILGRIILPQAFRLILPEGLNQLVSLFKATTLVSLISVSDMMYRVVLTVGHEMRPLPLYSSAAIVYFALIFAMSAFVKKITDRWRTRSWA